MGKLQSIETPGTTDGSTMFSSLEYTDGCVAPGKNSNFAGLSVQILQHSE